MSMLSRLSPDARRYVVEDLAETYFAGGFSPDFKNGPQDERERRIYPELVAVGLMERSPSKMLLFQFTGAGLREVLALRSMSAEAATLLAEIKRRYQPGKSFRQGELLNHKPYAFSELVARGRLEKREEDKYALIAGS